MSQKPVSFKKMSFDGRTVWCQTDAKGKLMFSGIRIEKRGDTQFILREGRKELSTHRSFAAAAIAAQDHQANPDI